MHINASLGERRRGGWHSAKEGFQMVIKLKRLNPQQLHKLQKFCNSAKNRFRVKTVNGDKWFYCVLITRVGIAAGHNRNQGEATFYDEFGAPPIDVTLQVNEGYKPDITSAETSRQYVQFPRNVLDALFETVGYFPRKKMTR
jgi:hypothetical protein